MGDADRSWTAVTREQFVQAVESLPEESRVVFELRAFGHAYDQIAEQLQISREAVTARLRLARTLLRATLASMVQV
jgi:RNA polymerase sigma factor (sigma-70 family)